MPFGPLLGDFVNSFLPSPSTSTIWGERLLELDAQLRRAMREGPSREAFEWTVHGWASRELSSAAIRMGVNEGLTGPAPAKWRILVHLEAAEASPSYALAILDGRAPLRRDTVLAASLVDGRRLAPVIAVRNLGCRLGAEPLLATGGDRPTTTVASPLEALHALVDLALGEGGPVAGAYEQLGTSLDLAAGLVLEQLGGELSATPSAKPTRFAARRPAGAVSSTAC